MMSPDFQHILRVLNTNIDGRRKVMFALCKIQGIGRRFSNLICKKAEVDPHKRCVASPGAGCGLVCFTWLAVPGSAARRLFTPNCGPSLCRAGELTQDEVEKLVAIIQSPKQFKIPEWFLNRQREWKTGKTMQAFSNNLAAKLREDLERLKKIRNHRGLRHYWGIRVRGQHTKTTGRRGKTMAVAGK